MELLVVAIVFQIIQGIPVIPVTGMNDILNFVVNGYCYAMDIVLLPTGI